MRAPIGWSPSDANSQRASPDSGPASMGVRSRPANSPIATTTAEVRDERPCGAGPEAARLAAPSTHRGAAPTTAGIQNPRRAHAEGQEFQRSGEALRNDGAQVHDRARLSTRADRTAPAMRPAPAHRESTTHRHRWSRAVDARGEAGRQEREHQRRLAERDDAVDERPLAEHGHDARRGTGTGAIAPPIRPTRTAADHASTASRHRHAGTLGLVVAVMRGSSTAARPGCPGAGR